MRNCVDLAQDRYYRRALVNAALNIQVPLAMELFLRGSGSNNNINSISLEISVEKPI